MYFNINLNNIIKSYIIVYINNIFVFILILKYYIKNFSLYLIIYSILKISKL